MRGYAAKVVNIHQTCQFDMGGAGCGEKIYLTPGQSRMYDEIDFKTVNNRMRAECPRSGRPRRAAHRFHPS
jgi:hypothetical protein